MIKRVINKAENHQEAEKWDIVQQIGMSPEERQKVAKELKKRFFGKRISNVRKKKR